MKDLQTALSNERGSNSTALQELKEARHRVEFLTSKIQDLEAANLNLNQKISDMGQNMEDMKSGHRAQVHAKDDEIKRLLDELANQMKEYQNLQVSMLYNSFSSPMTTRPRRQNVCSWETFLA